MAVQLVGATDVYLSMQPYFSNRVTARPTPYLWIFAAIMLGVAVVCLVSWHPATPKDITARYVLSACYGSIGFLLSYYLARTHVTATPAGIAWSNWKESGSVTWDAVVDYYDDFRNTGQMPSKVSVIDTATGAIVFGTDWQHAKDLRGAVSQYAATARAETWGTRGARSCDMEPIAFRYDKRRIRSEAYLFPVMIACVPLLLYGDKWRHIVRNFGEYSSMGLWWSIGYLFLLAVPLSMFYAMIGFILLPKSQAERKRANDIIITDQEGIKLERPSDNVRIAWKDVTKITAVIVSARGIRTLPVYTVSCASASIDYLASIQRSSVLKAIIEARSVNATLDEASLDSVDKITEPEGVGVVPNNAVAYSYQTRTVRALWIFLVVFSTRILASVWESYAGIARHSGASVEAVYWSALPLTVSLLLWFTNWRTRIVIGEDRITYKGLLSSTTIPWERLESIEQCDAALVKYHKLVASDGRMIRVFAWLQDYSAVLATIKARAPQATWDE